jgi:hypothetical protein
MKDLEESQGNSSGWNLVVPHLDEKLLVFFGPGRGVHGMAL